VNSYRSIPYLHKVFVTTEDRLLAKKKQRSPKFSVVKAVKANARERVGQPRPERAIPEQKSQESRKAKYRPSLREILSEE
jgi:hypothetical protein